VSVVDFDTTVNDCGRDVGTLSTLVDSDTDIAAEIPDVTGTLSTRVVVTADDIKDNTECRAGAGVSAVSVVVVTDATIADKGR